MKYLKALVMMQLKDKLNFDFLQSKQKRLSFIIFTILKFVVVTAVAFLFFMLSSMLKIFSIGGGVPKNVMVVIYAIIFLMSLFSCTMGLMKTLYFADDNKILITLPVDGNTIFISRLIVYYVFEIKRSIFLTIPIFLAFGINAGIGVTFFIWLPIIFLFVSAVPVLIGAILSIPAMYVYRFMQKVSAVKYVTYFLLIAVGIFAVVKIIALIPTNIDLSQQLGAVQNAMGKLLHWSGRYVYPVNKIVDVVIGYPIPSSYGSITYSIFDLKVLLYFGILLVLIAVLGFCSFMLAKPLFITMVSKSFEFEKTVVEISKPNKRLNRIASFFKTETSNFVRSGLTASFLSVYIIVPVLIFFINKIFGAIDTRTSGEHMVYAFNLLLILLPMLASNALIATLFSRDGKASYVKKTFPINPVYPLTIKLIPSIVLSSISLITSVCIFGNMVKFSAISIFLLCVGCVTLNVGHIFWCATLDIMNPQNESYATSGEMEDNPNEKSATIIAFITSAIFAFFSFILFSDMVANSVFVACLKLGCIGLAYLSLLVYMYVIKIKIYYSEK